jgi:hypothetical protein
MVPGAFLLPLNQIAMNKTETLTQLKTDLAAIKVILAAFSDPAATAPEISSIVAYSLAVARMSVEPAAENLERAVAYIERAIEEESIPFPDPSDSLSDPGVEEEAAARPNPYDAEDIVEILSEVPNFAPVYHRTAYLVEVLIAHASGETSRADVYPGTARVFYFDPITQEAAAWIGDRLAYSVHFRKIGFEHAAQ